MLYRGRTDLASESFRQFGNDSEELTEIDGVRAVRDKLDGLEVFSVEILSGKAHGKIFYS